MPFGKYLDTPDSNQLPKGLVMMSNHPISSSIITLSINVMPRELINL
jgi:hypothetical protein